MHQSFSKKKASTSPRIAQSVSQKVSANQSSTNSNSAPLTQLQQLANKSLQTQKTVQLREVANNLSVPNSIQRIENNTGLPDNLKAGIEKLSGYSMNDIKVHYNSNKPAQLNAHAYAQGTDIHVATGQEKHLAHEAWHVVQQKQGRVRPTLQMKGQVNINDNPALEREADIMGAKALRTTEVPTKKATQQMPTTTAPIQRVKNKLGFEIEFRKNPVFRPLGEDAKGVSDGFLSGIIKIKTPQTERTEMQPDAARSSGINRALKAIPEAWRSEKWKEMDKAWVPEVKTKVEYAREEVPLLMEDLEFIQRLWESVSRTTMPRVIAQDNFGGMLLGVPVAELIQWVVRPPNGEVERDTYEAICQKLSVDLVAGWDGTNTPALHLQVTSGINLKDVGSTFEEQSKTLTERLGAVEGLEGQQEVLRTIKILSTANELANEILSTYAQKRLPLENPGAVHGAWTLMFQDLLRLIIGVKIAGSSAKNTFAFLPRSTETTLMTIGASIPHDASLLNTIMSKAEMLLVGALYRERNIAPDAQTLSFLHGIKSQINKEGTPPAPEPGGEPHWAYRFTALFAAMDSFAHVVEGGETKLPWSIKGEREIKSPKEGAVLLEDRHINKFVTDWGSVVRLIEEALGKVRE